MVEAADLDLDACAREPIRIPGAIQPHGCLFAFSEDGSRCLQVSANAASVLGRSCAELAEKGLRWFKEAAFDGVLGDSLLRWSTSGGPTLHCSASNASRTFRVTAHRNAQGIVVEFEPVFDGEHEDDGLYARLGDLLEAFADAGDFGALCHSAAVRMRELTGFDRVLVYQFDEDWNGRVIAEDGNGELPSYLDLRFPASDIPAQARELYRLNRLRFIPDADYDPVPLEPALSPVDGQPLDMSYAVLRSVSPVHLQYMRNMGTYASMSVSIIVEQRLWGLVSCHNRLPRQIGAKTRAACDLLGQNLALQIAAREHSIDASQRIELKGREAELLVALTSRGDVMRGLASAGDLWMSIARAEGAAILMGDEIVSVGNCPDDDQIRALTDWLQDHTSEDVFATDHLARHWPEATTIKETASGIVAVSISQLHRDTIFWFRGEVVSTVTWGGDPRKPQSGAMALDPRRSFDAWKEQVRLRSRPWTAAEIDSARDFRTAVTNFVLRRAEERAALTEELQRSNRELESFSYSISHDLRAPFRHIVGFAELLADRNAHLDEKSLHYLASITEAAKAAGRLVDDLLNFSQLGRSALSRSDVDTGKLVQESRRTLGPSMQDRSIEWRIGDLPPAYADAAMLRQVFLNLVDNAVKYTRGRDPAIIEISGERHSDETVYRVRDNGVGFEMAYSAKLFGVFQRLHRAEEFEGTGIGLALSKRIIERHGGWIQAEGEPDRGATVTFALPRRKETNR